MSCADSVSGVLTVRLEGTFDGRAARKLRESLEQVSEPEVVLDFSAVREFRDSAAHALSGLRRPSLRLRGLARHHERLFCYLGLLAHVAPAREHWEPEEAAQR